MIPISHGVTNRKHVGISAIPQPSAACSSQDFLRVPPLFEALAELTKISRNGGWSHSPCELQRVTSTGGKKTQEGKGIKMQSQILVWPLPLRGEISHGQHGRWHPGLSIHHHQEGGSCCQQQVGAAVSRLGFVLDGESVCLGSGWSVSTTPTYASCAKSQFHHLCAHNLKTRWGPQARRSVDWRRWTALEARIVVLNLLIIIN